MRWFEFYPIYQSNICTDKFCKIQRCIKHIRELFVIKTVIIIGTVRVLCIYTSNNNNNNNHYYHHYYKHSAMCVIMALISSDRVQITRKRSAFATRANDGSKTTECRKVLSAYLGVAGKAGRQRAKLLRQFVGDVPAGRCPDSTQINAEKHCRWIARLEFTHNLFANLQEQLSFSSRRAAQFALPKH